ncbi:MBOAT, membrane-bound O-acyltransferase family-domain-containing protein [Gongronella butleri]|nr:MBOAT, membrane-bound O-acyltransferase family-domain-containing protein [Gongronella butleri]
MQHPTVYISAQTGIPEASLRLLLTLLLAYPASLVYQGVYGQPPQRVVDDKVQMRQWMQARNRYVLLTGLSLALFFNGQAIYHSLVTCMVCYAWCWLLSARRTAAAAGVWLFNAVYLLWGYFAMASNDYEISWTMPQCVLCLRWMGLAFDFVDGGQKTRQKEDPTRRPLSFGADSPLETLPPFMHVLAYCYYPSAFLIGPQFSFSLYQRWLSMVPENSWVRVRHQTMYAVRCFLGGLFYLAVQQLIGSRFPSSYLITNEFAARPALERFGLFWLTGKFVFTKYLGVWLLTEGATAGFGLGYEGQKDGKHRFAGLCNVDPVQYETVRSINHIIASFNVNTNYWSKYYVFKRLMWVGNKHVSQFATLFFLASWHGIHHLGYFATFLLEFLDLMAERILRDWLIVLGIDAAFQRNRVTRGLQSFLAWFLCKTVLYYAGITFDLLDLSNAHKAYSTVYYYAHWGLGFLLVSGFFLPRRAAVKKMD